MTSLAQTTGEVTNLTVKGISNVLIGRLGLNLFGRFFNPMDPNIPPGLGGSMCGQVSSLLPLQWLYGCQTEAHVPFSQKGVLNDAGKGQASDHFYNHFYNFLSAAVMNVGSRILMG